MCRENLLADSLLQGHVLSGSNQQVNALDVRKGTDYFFKQRLSDKACRACDQHYLVSKKFFDLRGW